MMRANSSAHAVVETAARVRDLYRDYARPRTAQLLHAIGLDLAYCRAEGDYLFYRDERSGEDVAVLDMLGGFGATLFGHNHVELTSTLIDQLAAKRAVHAQASTRTEAAQLAERLSALVGKYTGRTYVTTLSNSGTEAVESALKHAELELWSKRRAWLQRLRANVARALQEAQEGRLVLATVSGDASVVLPSERSHAALSAHLAEVVAAAEAAAQRPPVHVAIDNAFHGKTLGSLQLTHNEKYRAPWQRTGFALFVPFDDSEALGRALRAQTTELTDLSFDQLGHAVLSTRTLTHVAALIAEPIQGEGGVRTLSREYLEAMRAAADEHGFALVFDEIQCGMGRTGTFLASELEGVRADYYVLSKSLGGGLVKVGALLVDRELYQHDFGYLHTSTFAEDDPSCAVALKSLELIERDSGQLLRDCSAKGAYLSARLESLQCEYPDVIAGVLGRGLMMGVTLRSQAESSSPLLRVLSEQHLLGFVISGYLLREASIRIAPALCSHDTLRVEPSAYIGREELDRFVAGLRAACATIRAADVAGLCRFALGDEHPPAARLSLVPAAVSGSNPPRRLEATRRVAFLAHFRDGRDLQLFDPGFSQYGAAACEAFLRKTSPVLQPFALEEREVRSASGDAVRLSVYVLPFTAAEASQALRSGKTERLCGLIEDAIDLAYAAGASIVGCGAYTSILTDNCRAIAHQRVGVTSGNSLTVAAAVQALLGTAATLSLGRRVMGVVGATGNIGATLAEVAADSVDEVVLVGRPGAMPRLARLAARLGKPTSVESDLAALRRCNMIVSASNAPTPIIRAEHLSEDPMVLCDVAVPSDVDPRVAALRGNARVIRGGMLRLPDQQDLGLPALDLSEGSVYACLGEALLLGLSGMSSSFSCGPLDAGRVRFIRSLAAHHGFSVDSCLK